MTACSGAFFKVTPEDTATKGTRPAAPPLADSVRSAPPSMSLPEMPEPEAVASDSAGVQRLMRLAMLWQTVRQHHPWIDDAAGWDAAVTRMIPAFRAAGSSDALFEATRTLLNVLQDSVTVAERAPEAVREPAGRADVRMEWVAGGDSVLVLRVPLLDRHTDRDSAVIVDALARDPARVVIDLRGDTRDAGAPAREAAEVFIARTALVPSLVATPLPLGQQRSRASVSRAGSPHDFLSGSTAARELATGAFVQESGTLPAHRARATRTAILVNNGSVVPTPLAAMVASGRAWLLSEDRVGDELLVPSVRVAMGDGVVVRVRTGDVQFPSALDPLRIDSLVGRGASANAADASVNAAVSLLRGTRTPRATAIAPRGRTASLGASAIDTLPYPYMGARLFAAFKVWSIMRTQYAHRDAYDDDIDAAFERAIPRAEAAQNREQYVRALGDLVASFDDSQVRLQRRSGDSRAQESSAPFRARVIEGRMLVTSLRPGASGTGIAVGTEITAADGYPIAAWLLEHRRDVSASNDWTRMRDLAERMPRGMAGNAVFKMRDATGPERTVSVARTPVADAPDAAVERTAERTAAPSRMIGEIVYADLARLDAEAAARAFAGLGGARAVVIDLRGPLALPPELVLRRLATRSEFTPARAVSRPMSAPCTVPSLREAARLCADERVTTPIVLHGDSASAFHGRVVVLIDERTQDAAERLALALEAGANATLVGSPSAGAAAPTVAVALPGNLTLHFPQVELRRADGGQLHRVGLTPSVDARPTVRGVRAGADDVLDRAIAWTMQQLDGSRRRR